MGCIECTEQEGDIYRANRQPFEEGEHLMDKKAVHEMNTNLLGTIIFSTCECRRVDLFNLNASCSS